MLQEEDFIQSIEFADRMFKIIPFYIVVMFIEYMTGRVEANILYRISHPIMFLFL